MSLNVEGVHQENCWHRYVLWIKMFYVHFLGCFFLIHAFDIWKFFPEFRPKNDSKILLGEKSQEHLTLNNQHSSDVLKTSRTWRYNAKIQQFIVTARNAWMGITNALLSSNEIASKTIGRSMTLKGMNIRWTAWLPG